jgi:hypothetical protein
MILLRTRQAAVGGLVSVVALFASTAVPVAADAADPPAFPKGVACADFDVDVTSTGGNTVFREFFDANGNIVRSLSAGTGQARTFTSSVDGVFLASLSLPANGAVTQTTFAPDGTATVVLTGHNVLIMFPTDVPAGPSTTLYIGRVVFTVDTNNVFTLQGEPAGIAIDICAALTP